MVNSKRSLVIIKIILSVVLIREVNCLCLISESPIHDLIVKLAVPRSRIKGHILQSEKGNNFYAFQEIPYAQPPIGNLRYKVPLPHPGWRGILNTTQNTRVCSQVIATALPQSEDCLFLNVYTPVKPGSTSNLAVFVWIHGGGYIVWDGTIRRYSPVYLIDYDIIVVTIEYRLGVLGFLSTDDGVIAGNIGLRDQTLALQWVKDNIHLFGGDPNKVTIGGESAGSSSTSFQILSKLSRGLFRGAIVQTGSAVNTYTYVPKPGLYAFAVGQLIDNSIDQQNTTRLLEVLQAADVNDLLDASEQVTSVDGGVGLVNDLIWAPTLETVSIEEPFVNRPMHESYMVGDFAQAALLIGFTSEEMVWFSPLSSVSNPWKVNTEEELIAKMEYFDADNRRLVNKKLNIDEDVTAVVGGLFKEMYTNSTFVEDPDSFVRLSSDFFFTHGTIRQADTSSNFVDVYLYQFDYYPFGGLGAPHTEELQYFWKGDEDPGFVNSFQPILRDRLCKLWTNFIKCLNPTPVPDEDFGYVLWPKVKSNNVSYLNLNETFEVRVNPRQYYQIREILNYYLRAPFIVY